MRETEKTPIEADDVNMDRLIAVIQSLGSVIHPAVTVVEAERSDRDSVEVSRNASGKYAFKVKVYFDSKTEKVDVLYRVSLIYNELLKTYNDNDKNKGENDE